MVNGRRMNVTQNRKLFKEIVVHIFGRVTYRCGWRDRQKKMKLRMNKLVKECVRMEILKCRLVGMNVKKRLYEGLMIPTALHVAEIRNMGAAERRENVMEASEEYSIP